MQATIPTLRVKQRTKQSVKSRYTFFKYNIFFLQRLTVVIKTFSNAGIRPRLREKKCKIRFEKRDHPVSSINVGAKSCPWALPWGGEGTHKRPYIFSRDRCASRKKKREKENDIAQDNRRTPINDCISFISEKDTAPDVYKSWRVSHVTTRK